MLRCLVLLNIRHSWLTFSICLAMLAYRYTNPFQFPLRLLEDFFPVRKYVVDSLQSFFNSRFVVDNEKRREGYPLNEFLDAYKTYCEANRSVTLYMY